MQIHIYRGESKRLVVGLMEKNMPFNITGATNVRAYLKSGSKTFKYSLTNEYGHGQLTIKDTPVGIPPVPEEIAENEIALYLEASETQKYEPGMVHIDVEVFFLDTAFPSGKRVEKFCLKPASVFDVC